VSTDDFGVRRLAFLGARRNASTDRYDAVFARPDDAAWRDIEPSHASWLERMLELTRAGGTVLDAACGAGKYWSRVQASGRTIVGTDQLDGVLEVARSIHPDVPTGRVTLQDLAFDATFDAVMCVDALEDIVPEDWPSTVRALATAARSGAPLYLTVELIDPTRLQQSYQEAIAAGHPVVPGERFDGVGYHYYPARGSVLAWLSDSGLDLLDETDGDGYWHLLLRRLSAPG
jgi:2-polyprenyl-3-methyl-5-hydroxy-6-metoxy-1,4-benzoquinol methylase